MFYFGKKIPKCERKKKGIFPSKFLVFLGKKGEIFQEFF
jgi:hypothetical protein